MGWLILGVFAGIVGIGLSYSQNEESLAQQEEQNRITNYDKSIDQINDATTQIENTLIEIEKTQSDNKTYQSEIDTANEWLDNYQKMLGGDRTETALGRELYGLEGALATAKEKKSVYEAESRVQKQTAYDEAFSSYSQMLKQKSLLNVAASGTGQMEGAYSATQLIQSQSIRRFIGNDMIFNSDGEGTSIEDGSFLMSYSTLKREIKSNLEYLSLQIDIANNNIADFYDKYETIANENQATIEDRTSAIERNERTINTYKETIKTQQNNAINALKDAFKYNGGEDDISQIKSHADRLDSANASVENITGDSAGYNAKDTIAQAEEEARKKKEEEEARRKAQEEANRARDNDDIVVKEEKTQAQSTAERDNEKGKALTEAIKNSDGYKTYLANKNNQAANEIGKSQTEYYKQQLEKEEENKNKNKNKKKETGANKRVTQ